MGRYYRKWTNPDGDCFFHSIRELLIDRGDEGVASAGDMRRALARRAARVLFDSDLGEIATIVKDRKWQDLPPAINDEAARDLVDDLQPAFLSHLRRMEIPRKPSWFEQHPRRKYALFIALFGSGKGDLATYADAAEALGVTEAVDGLVWGDVDEGGVEGEDPGGFAMQLVRIEYDLYNVLLVRGQVFDLEPLRMEVFDLTEPDENHAYLWYSGGHFQPVLWTDQDWHRSPPGTGSRQPEITHQTGVLVSREEVNTIAGSLVLGVVTWNINHLGEQQVTALQELLNPPPPVHTSTNTRPRRKSAKRRQGHYKDTKRLSKPAKEYSEAVKVVNKLRALEDLLDQNRSWLDVLALQEVGHGIEYLATKQISNKAVLLQGDDLYSCHRGPHLQSVGGSGNPSSGQHEYYPILIPKDRTGAQQPKDLEYLGWTAVFGSGHVEESQKPDDTRTLRWAKQSVFDKAKEEAQKKILELVGQRMFRPVVVHRLRADGQRVNIAVVHTSPAGTELERGVVYSQVEELFHMVARGDLDRAGERERADLWVVTGDFYLFGEASAFRQTSGSQTASIGDRANNDPIIRERVLEYLENTIEEYEARIEDYQQQQPVSPFPKKRKFTEQEEASAKSRVWMALEKAVKTMKHLRTKLKEGKKKCSSVISGIFDVESDLVSAMDTEPEPVTTKKVKKEDPKSKRKHKHKKEKTKEEVKPTTNDDDEEDEEDEDISGIAYFRRAREQGRRPFFRLRNVLGYSVGEQLGRDFLVIQAPAGTNVHASADIEKPEKSTTRESTIEGGQDQSIEYTPFRIADFFVADRRWASHEAGMVVKSRTIDDDEIPGGGMVWVDDEQASITKAWRKISDHFPMGVCLSTAPNDQRVTLGLRPEKADVREIARLYEEISAFEGDEESEIMSGAERLRELTESEKWPSDPTAKDTLETQRELLEELLDELTREEEEEDTSKDDENENIENME